MGRLKLIGAEEKYWKGREGFEEGLQVLQPYVKHTSENVFLYTLSEFLYTPKIFAETEINFHLFHWTPVVHNQ